MSDYSEFLKAKADFEKNYGQPVEATAVNPILKEHQRDIPDDILQELRILHEAARGLVGNTPRDDPKRKAGEAFCALAAKTLTEYAVSATSLSLALGLSRSNIRLRLGRHGYMDNPPSQSQYVGTGIGSNTGKGKRTSAYRAQSVRN